MPWQGNEHQLIDKFDGRALLDPISIATFKASGRVRPPPNPDEQELESKICYERYRSIIEYTKAKGDVLLNDCQKLKFYIYFIALQQLAIHVQLFAKREKTWKQCL